MEFIVHERKKATQSERKKQIIYKQSQQHLCTMVYILAHKKNILFDASRETAHVKHQHIIEILVTQMPLCYKTQRMINFNTFFNDKMREIEESESKCQRCHSNQTQTQ